MDALCLNLIASSTGIQLAAINAVLACCSDEWSTPSRCAYLPPSSPGHPPYPHATSVLEPLPEQDVHSQVVHIPVTVDAFDVLNQSPSLGAALLTAPDTQCRPSLERAFTQWLRRAAHMASAPLGLDAAHHAAPPAQLPRPSEAWRRVPPALLSALAQGQVPLEVSLLVLRVPHLLTGHALDTSRRTVPRGSGDGSTDLLSSPTVSGMSVPAARRAHVCRTRETAMSPVPVPGASTPDGPDHQKGGSRWTLQSVSDIPRLTADLSSVPTETEAGHTPPPVVLRLPRASSGSRELPPSSSFSHASQWGFTTPPDAVIGTGLAPLHCAVVVTAVSFASRRATQPLPIARVRALSPSLCHGFHDDLVVDLRDLASSSSRLDLARAVVVGCVWVLRGVVRASPLPTRRTPGAGHKEGTRLWYHVTATDVRLPLLRRRHRRCLDAPCADDAGMGPDEAPDAVAEERAARETGVWWEGMRLALGTTTTPTTLTTTIGFFSLSLDAVVAVLIALGAAHAPQEEGAGGVSVVLVDEAGCPFLPPLVQRVAQMCPSSVRWLQPTSVAGGAGRWDWQSLLPAYHTSAAQPPSRAAALSTTDAADHAQSLLDLSSHAQESIACGALSAASGCTSVLEALDGLPVSVLHFWRDCLGTHGTHGTHGTVAAAAAAAGRGEAAGPVGAETGPHAEGSGAPPAMAERVVRREGGQQVPYYVSRALLATVRGSKMPSAALFELLRRADVVVRPCVNRHRKQLSLFAATDGQLQAVLESRRGWWSHVAGEALSLLRTAAHAAAMTPELSEHCSRLLRLYFLAARASFPSVVDSSLMETLTKLTCCHASLRLRVVSEAHRHAHAALGPPDAPPTLTTTTCVMDAIVAIGLCDAKLYFETKQTVLRRCVFQILEADLMAARATRVDEVTEPDSFWHRVAEETSWPPLPGDVAQSPFSILRLAAELETYLCAQLPR